MPSANYRIIFKAIQKKQLLLFTYQGFRREAYPHVLGHTDGKEKVLVFQVGGGSRKGLSAEGAWRCPDVPKITDLKALNADGFRGGDSHTKSNTCVKDVDIDVNRKAKQHYIWPAEPKPAAAKKAARTKRKTKPAKRSGKKSPAPEKQPKPKAKRAAARKRKRAKRRRKSKSPA